MKLTIRNIRVRPVMAPLKRPPRSASGEIPTAPLALVDLETAEGITGRAYLFAFHDYLLKPLVSTLEGLAGLIRGDAVAPIALDAKLRARLTLFGTDGTVGLALSGIDMAAWDALAQAQGVPLAVLLGGEIRPVRAYNSCGLWIKDPALLADEAEQLLAEGGFGAVKLRIGRDDFEQDLAAVRNVKKRIGGVTGWLRAAALAQAHGLDMSSHLFPEYSAHLLAVTPTCHWLEYMDWANAVLAEPFEVKNGHVRIPDRPGSGVAWDESAVKKYLAG